MQDSNLQPGVKGTSSRLAAQIIETEYDYFDSEHEQEQVLFNSVLFLHSI